LIEAAGESLDPDEKLAVDEVIIHNYWKASKKYDLLALYQARLFVCCIQMIS